MSNPPPPWSHSTPPAGSPTPPPAGSPAPPAGSAATPPQHPVPPSPFRPLQPPPVVAQQTPGTPGPSIEQFAAPKDRRPLWIVGITTLVAVAALASALFLGRPAATTVPSPSAGPASGPSSTRTPNPNGQGVPFSSPREHVSGYWEITEQEWDSTGVRLHLSISVDEGELRPNFYVFNNTTNAQYRVDLSASPAPAFPATPLSAPATYTGNIYVTAPHVEGTLVMFNKRRTDAVSALPIRE